MKNKIILGISIISILLIFFILGTDKQPSINNTVYKITGYEEPEGGASYIEALGLQYLTLGSIFSYGVNDETIFYYFESLLNTELAYEEDDLLKVFSEPVESTLSLEELISIERSDFKDENNNTIDNTEIVRITTPRTFDTEKLETTSNLWQYDYRFYKGGFVGVDKAIWYSQVFSDDLVFNRAWNSLKWLSQDRINCEILDDYDDYFSIFVYGSDDYNWYVNIYKKTDDLYNTGKIINYFEMDTVPLNEENSISLLQNYGLITSAD